MEHKCDIKAMILVGGMMLLPALGTQAVSAAESVACSASAKTLKLAKQRYKNQCVLPLKDCDKSGQNWICASTNVESIGNRLTQNLPAPVIVRPGNNAQVVANGSSVSSSSNSCIDTDGDGWGWDGYASCKVGSDSIGSAIGLRLNSTPVMATSRSNCVDHDGDGWGWNGTASCLMNAPVDNFVWQDVLPEKQQHASSVVGNCEKLDSGAFHITELVTDVILTAGQSNAAGNNTVYQPETNDKDKGNNRFIVWTSKNTWEIVNPRAQIWHATREYPRGHERTFNHPGFQIGRAITNSDHCRVVALIATAAPGEAIDHWLYDKDLHMTYIRQKVSSALNALPRKYKLDMIWWMQGESDNDQIVDRYYWKLKNLISTFRGEPWFEDNGLFLANETRESIFANQAIRRLDHDDDAYTSSSLGEDSARHRFPQIRSELVGVHFNEVSLRKIGDLVAEKYLWEYLPKLGQR